MGDLVVGQDPTKLSCLEVTGLPVVLDKVRPLKLQGGGVLQLGVVLTGLHMDAVQIKVLQHHDVEVGVAQPVGRFCHCTMEIG